MSAKKRVFVGLSLPNALTQELGTLRADIGVMQWIPKRNLHLTLRFIGGVDEAQLASIIAALRNVSAFRFTLNLHHMGQFHKHTLWMGTDLPDGLILLKQVIDNAINEAGFTPDDKPFIPHITLARIKKISQRVLDEYLKQHQRNNFPSVDVDHFILYQSNTESGGAEYTPLAIFKLQ